MNAIPNFPCFDSTSRKRCIENPPITVPEESCSGSVAAGTKMEVRVDDFSVVSNRYSSIFLESDVMDNNLVMRKGLWLILRSKQCGVRQDNLSKMLERLSYFFFEGHVVSSVPWKVVSSSSLRLIKPKNWGNVFVC